MKKAIIISVIALLGFWLMITISKTTIPKPVSSKFVVSKESFIGEVKVMTIQNIYVYPEGDHLHSIIRILSIPDISVKDELKFAVTEKSDIQVIEVGVQTENTFYYVIKITDYLRNEPTIVYYSKKVFKVGDYLKFVK